MGASFQAVPKELTVKVVRRYATAARLSDGNPIIQIVGPSGSKMFVVFNGKPTVEEIAKTEIAVLRQGHYCGHVTVRGLDRLGRAQVGQPVREEAAVSQSDDTSSVRGPAAQELAIGMLRPAPVPVTALASAAPVSTPFKVGALPAETRLTWHGGGHLQKGNSREYNAWMARTGTFTVQAAMDAGIPKHHIRYVTGQGWVRRA